MMLVRHILHYNSRHGFRQARDIRTPERVVGDLVRGRTMVVGHPRHQRLQQPAVITARRLHHPQVREPAPLQVLYSILGIFARYN